MRSIVSSLSIVTMLLVCPMSSAEDNGRMSFHTNPYHTNVGSITRIEGARVVWLAKLNNPRLACGESGDARSDLTEGIFIAFVGEDVSFATDRARLPTTDTAVIRLKVLHVNGDGSARIRVSEKARDLLKVGQHVAIFRPPGSSTDSLESAPDCAVMAPASTEERCVANLLRIGDALRNWSDTWGGLPPCVVRGPEGKPWHSWRVLVLPWLGEARLFNEYRFEEPWDGPNNRQLLARIPDVFRSPEHPDAVWTQVLAVTGEDTAFPTAGITNTDPESMTIGEYQPGTHALRWEDITDGASDTLLIGMGSAEDPVPWMKPVDIQFSEELPAPGSAGSFAAPFGRDGSKRGLFLWADGSVSSIQQTVHAADFRAYCTATGDEEVDFTSPTDRDVSQRTAFPGITESSIIHFHKRNDSWSAELKLR